MEETLQQEKQESEYKNLNEDQGGIRRRLRDRDLLRKRKAEAEEKETNQEESQRKRSRAEGGTKRRGRPKKSVPTTEISVIQEEAAVPQDAPAVVVVPEPAEVIPDQTPGSHPLHAVESQHSFALAAPAPQPVPIQTPVFAPTLSSPAPPNPTPVLFSPLAPAPSLAKVLDMAPIPVQDPSAAPDAVPFPVPVPVPLLTQGPVAVEAPAPPAAPSQVNTLFTESQDRETLDQVLIEDLGPDDKEDIPSSQDKRADEDLIETPSIYAPEENEMFSVPTMSSPPPQKYFPGNSF